jgi:hypothetical protein
VSSTRSENVELVQDVFTVVMYTTVESSVEAIYQQTAFRQTFFEDVVFVSIFDEVKLVRV